MIEIQEHPLTRLDELRQHNEDLLAQAEEERARLHLWNATLTMAQYHDAEAKRRGLMASQEVSRA